MNEPTCIQTYLNEICRNPVLTREEESDLFQRLEKGEEGIRERIIQCNLKFVIQISQRFRNRGLPFEDLVQEGNIGLMEAVQKFDWRLGFRFSTYAAFWIRQAIQVAVRQRGSIIRLPVRKSRMLGFMNEVMHEYWCVRGRAPSDVELAERLGTTPEQARELARMGEAVLSLDTPVEEGGVALMDVIPDVRSRTIEETCLVNERRAKVADAMSSLSERESRVLRARFGLSGGSARSLRKVSARMGLSQEGVRRIEQRALAKLRRSPVRQSMVGLL